MTADQLHGALKAAGIPIRGVSMKDGADRSTWAVEYDQGATPEQISAGEAVLAAFDPDDPVVKDAQTDGEARVLANARQIRAFWLWFFRETHDGKDPTPEERADATDRLVQAYKDTPE
jgi:hypothetical protein